MSRTQMWAAARRPGLGLPTDVPSLVRGERHEERILLLRQICRRADAWEKPRLLFVSLPEVPATEMYMVCLKPGVRLRATRRPWLPSPTVWLKPRRIAQRTSQKPKMSAIVESHVSRTAKRGAPGLGDEKLSSRLRLLSGSFRRCSW